MILVGSGNSLSEVDDEEEEVGNSSEEPLWIPGISN